MEEVLGIARPKYNLRAASRVIDTGMEITGKVTLGTTVTGKEKVPELVEASISGTSFSDVTFEEWKNVVHVAVSDESELKSRISVMNLQVEDGGRDIARMEDKQISEEMATATAVGGASWSTATNDPLTDIRGVADAIEALGYEPNLVIMARDTYTSFVLNPLVRDRLPEGATADGIIESFGGYRIMKANSLASSTAIVMDTTSSAIVLFDGPTIVRRYDMGAAFGIGYAVAKFLEPVLVVGDGIRQLTGVA